MLEAAIRACPKSGWRVEGRIAASEHAYHAISSVDFWLRDMSVPFVPRAFHDESAALMRGPADVPPAKDVLLGYLAEMRAKCGRYLDVADATLLAEETLRGRPLSMADRALMQIRHVQHHVGVLHRMVHEHTDTDLSWRG